MEVFVPVVMVDIIHNTPQYCGLSAVLISCLKLIAVLSTVERNEYIAMSTECRVQWNEYRVKSTECISWTQTRLIDGGRCWVVLLVLPVLLVLLVVLLHLRSANIVLQDAEYRILD